MKTAFLFPGQGAQYVGMGRQLIETVPQARRLFDQAQTILGYDLAALCQNGPAERLNATDISQPAIFVTSLAALESLKVSDPSAAAQCVATAGLSLGEYTALVFAGALSFEDGLRIVKIRGEAMQAASLAHPGAMTSLIGPDLAQVEEFCKAARAQGHLQLANFLCPGNTVVSGEVAAIAAVEKIAEDAGARVIRLVVAGAFHTAFMKPADEKLAGALAQASLKTPGVPVWSNVDAQAHTEPEEIENLLVRQVLQPVLWEQTLRRLLESGVERFYEIGPGRVLAGLLKRVQRKVECINVAG